MKRYFKVVDTFQIIGFTISTAVSIILIFASVDPVLSTILGLLLAIFVQLFDFQLRLADTESKLLQANALSQQLYGDEWLLEQVQKLVNDYLMVKASWYEPFFLRAKDSLIECSNILHELSEGHMIHFTGAAQSPYSFGTDGVKRAKESLKAVGPADRDFWRSKSGVSYLEEQLSAISRGVQLTRIFLNPPDVLLQMKDVMEEQQKAGVKVFVAIRDEIPKELHSGYIIMDDKLVNQAEFTGNGRIKHWKMSIDKFEVEQIVRQFDILLRRSRPLDVFLTTHNNQEGKTE